MAKINNWDGVNQALRGIADQERQIEQIKSYAEQKISEIRARMKNSSEACSNIIATQSALVEEFVAAHRGELDPGAKSKKLTFGMVGFRNETKLSWPKKSETVLERLKQKGLEAYIRVKEEIDKAGIFAHRQSLPLDDLGIKEKTEESFFIDLKKEVVQ